MVLWEERRGVKGRVETLHAFIPASLSSSSGTEAQTPKVRNVLNFFSHGSVWLK